MSSRSWVLSDGAFVQALDQPLDEAAVAQVELVSQLVKYEDIGTDGESRAGPYLQFPAGKLVRALPLGQDARH